MKQLIYIHGGDCFRTEKIFYEALERRTCHPFQERKRRKHWLAAELKNSHQVDMPDMPNKYNARYKAWKIWFEKIFPYVNTEELVIVGYSLGATFLAKYLSENIFPKKISQLHLLAGCFDESDFPESGERDYLADFTFDPAGLKNMEQQTDKIFLYHSKDDPSVPFVHVEKFKFHLPEAKLNIFEDRGHFRQPEFPELLENIRK